jgi:hypothetical protein
MVRRWGSMSDLERDDLADAEAGGVGGGEQEAMLR